MSPTLPDFLFLIVAIAGIVLCGLYYSSTRTIRVKELGEYKKEKLIPNPKKKRKVGNVAIVELEGTPYEIGCQNGALMKEEIRALLKEACDRYLPKWKPRGMLARALITNYFKRVDKETPLEFRQEMQGVADGAEVSYNDILLINLLLDGFSGLNPLILQLIYSLSGLEPGCSSIIVNKGKKSKQMMLGQTVDYVVTIGAGCSVLYIIKKLGKRLLFMPSFPGVVIAINGMNEAGLILTQRGTPTDGGKLGMPASINFRQLLEEFTSLDEARRYINQTDWKVPRSIIIADSRRNQSSIFEILPEKGVKEIITKDGQGAANHFKTPEYLEVQRTALERYRFLRFFGPYERYLSLFDKTLHRERFLENYLKKETRITPEAIMETISDYDPRMLIPSGTVANRWTQQAMVFIPARKLIYIANGLTPPVTEAGFVKIDLRKWF